MGFKLTTVPALFAAALKSKFAAKETVTTKADKVLALKRKPKPWTDNIKATAMHKARWAARYGNANKYTPHQGKQECARRAMQLESGLIHNQEHVSYSESLA